MTCTKPAAIALAIGFTLALAARATAQETLLRLKFRRERC